MPNAILQIILAILPLVNFGSDILLKWVEEFRKAQQQTNEWTEEQESAYQATLRIMDKAHEPDPPLPPAA